MPSWLTLDSEAKTVYVTDENQAGRIVLSAYKVGADGKTTKIGDAQTPGGELHSCLFGGEDGKGYIAMAE
jgi:6-phosphogluconolactonase (cycloisomerase 2 family)